MHHTSYSQDDRFRRCKRSWVYKYIHKLSEPIGPALKFGVQMHEYLEEYFKTGKFPPRDDAGQAARAILVKTTAPDPSDLIEHPLDVELIPGVKFVGKADLIRGGTLIDFKSTSSKSWIPTPHDLQQGCQANLYATAVLLQLGLTIERTEFIYAVKKKKPEAIVVSTEIDEDIRLSTWSGLQDRAAEMLELRAAKPEPADVEGNYTACDMYGGCPFKQQCAPIFRREKAMATGNLLDKLAKKKATLTAPTVEVNPPEAPAELPEPAPEAEAAPAPKRGRPKKQPPPLWVCIGCYPTKGAPEPIMPLADIVDGAAAKVCADAGVVHWSLCDYGTGAGGLAAVFKDLAPRSGTVLVDPLTAEGKALMTTLEQLAAVVVRG